MNDFQKYAVAKEYRKGMACCISGGGCDETESEDWQAGWLYAYSNIKPQVNDAMQAYIVSKGYEPFEQVYAAREQGGGA